jgi:transcriptional regulator with XRE-family HTH domain
VNKESEAAKTNAAIFAQLNAEMKAHHFNVKTLAAALEVDYNTFRRYMNGERDFPLMTLWATLEVLETPLDVFTAAAKERLERG